MSFDTLLAVGFFCVLYALFTLEVGRFLGVKDQPFDWERDS